MIDRSPEQLKLKQDRYFNPGAGVEAEIFARLKHDSVPAHTVRVLCFFKIKERELITRIIDSSWSSRCCSQGRRRTLGK
jgi:hypothetical protein